MAAGGRRAPYPIGMESRSVTAQLCPQVHKEIGRFPLIIRPAFTLGGTGGGIAYNMEEYLDIVGQGLAASMTDQASVQRH
jgi:carbamoyl-phosphate synthase large subunit